MQRLPSYSPPTSNPHLFGVVAASILSFGLILASTVVAGAWMRNSESQLITVTGTSHRNVRSDLVIWRASFSAEADRLLEAQKRLNSDLGKVIGFLQANGALDYNILPVQIREITTHSDNNPDSVPVTIGYRLFRNIEVSSTEVEMLPRLSSESTDLLQQGVVFASQGVSFIYTKAGEAKVEMMAEATKDARDRADQIASQGKRKVKRLRSAKVGAIQVVPQHSTATGSEAINDTTSLNKTITATIAATFEMK